MSMVQVLLALGFAESTNVAPNPEAVINLALAVQAAQHAADQAAIISTFVLGMMFILMMAFIFVAYNFKRLEHNTNSIRDDLVNTTRMLATVQGEAKGKADQIKADQIKADQIKADQIKADQIKTDQDTSKEATK